MTTAQLNQDLLGELQNINAYIDELVDQGARCGGTDLASLTYMDLVKRKAEVRLELAYAEDAAEASKEQW